MITCKLAGGLGNYMFQIAATATLANQLGTDFVVDVSDHMVVHNDWTNYKENIFRNVKFGTPNVTNIHNFSGFPYSPLPLQDNIKLQGHPQSEKYLDRDLILDLFAVRLLVSDEMVSDFGITENSVSLHVRRGDFVGLQNHHPLCTMDYYEEAMDVIGRDKTFYVFSDDWEWCTKNFKDCYVVEPTYDWLDLILMSRCAHNIIANSTFSWWSAWLNENENKTVIAPKQWFGPAKNVDTSDLLPKEWIQI